MFCLYLRLDSGVILLPNNAKINSVKELLDSLGDKVLSFGKVEINALGGKSTVKVSKADENQPFPFTQEKDTGVIDEEFIFPIQTAKYIRTQGFNNTSESLVFVFSGNMTHRDTARIVTGDLISRVVSAGFVRCPTDNANWSIEDRPSETLNLGPILEMDEMTAVILDHNFNDEELIKTSFRIL